MRKTDLKPISSKLKRSGRALIRACCVWLLFTMPMTWLSVRAAESASVMDPQDLADSSGDIRAIHASVLGDMLQLSMTVEGVAAPSMDQTPEGKNNRYYYHWILDTDNDASTGSFVNSSYEGNATGVVRPVGAELFVQVGWRDGKPNGIAAYDPADDENPLATDFPYQVGGNTISVMIPLKALGLVEGQTIAVSAFQEGSSDGWAVDWIESTTLSLKGPKVPTISIADASDLSDSSGDIRSIGAYVIGDQLNLWMSVQGVVAPSVEQTLEEKTNRYYYHWMLDTDDDRATGSFVNDAYEGNATGVARPIGAELFVQVGWRDGKPNGVAAYDPADDENPLVTDFAFQASGNTLTATIPLQALGLVAGQTISLSAFQEGASDGWAVDWMESDTITLKGPAAEMAVISDPSDLADSSGDIRGVGAYVLGDSLYLSMNVQGVATPLVAQTPEEKTNRYYYHWMLDTDNDRATGSFVNDAYEGNPTGVTRPIGAELFVQVGWRDGKPNGVAAYDPADDENPLIVGFRYQGSGNTLTAVLPLESLGLAPGQTIALSAFQEGASDGWAVDWAESAVVSLKPVSSTEAPVVGVDDPTDLADSSGDIKRIEATLDGGDLVLRMAVYGTILPSVEETPEGKVNRYYYHWMLDTDNDPATGGFVNDAYEGNATGVTRPIGAELFVQVGWRDGEANGIAVFDPADDENPLLVDFAFSHQGDSMEARLPLAALGLTPGQTIAFSAFQEGASDGWAVDWMESGVITLSENTGISLAAAFRGNAYGFEVELSDTADLQANPTSVQASVDGQLVTASASKQGAVTLITAKNPVLLSTGLHIVALSVEVGGNRESQEFPLSVGPYTVLPSLGRLSTLDTSKRGFVVNTTQISSEQSEVPAVHEDRADLAEQQITGKLVNEMLGRNYYNEADPAFGFEWKVTPATAEGVINWFGLAPEQEPETDRFPGDGPIPNLTGLVSAMQGDAIEIMTYLHLEEGYYKIGLHTEGGYKANAGFSPGGPVLGLFDDSGGVNDRIPGYYGRTLSFDVVAASTGYYPVRVLWFQSDSNQEAAPLLELFTSSKEGVHLINDTSDPLSIGAYRAGALLQPGFVWPILSFARGAGGALVIEFTGTLESAAAINGPWTQLATESNSPQTVTPSESQRFFRARTTAP